MPLLALGLAGGVALALLRPRPAHGYRAGAAWIACIALSLAGAGLGLGSLRIAAIDGGALRLDPGSRVAVRGFVAAVPRRTAGEVSVRLDTGSGRLLAVVPEPVPDLAVGSRVLATGTIHAPPDWQRAHLTRLGILSILRADSLGSLPGRRAGLTGELDAIRARAEAALGEGTSEPAAALLRGFVLGQDDRIDANTVEEFKRSGLAHLLAVSGQNVALLAVLVGALLAALAVPLRARLLWILALIAVYVPVAGAGASIQRAGVMGAAAVVAALADRPRSRWYALLLAAAVTLALDPRATADVGWQLSFAAVAGILLWSSALARTLGSERGGLRRGLAEGLALTIAASLATAPLMALHFETLSLVSLPANVLALPAVAPVMWLGMLAGGLGQLPGLPVEPVTALAGVFAGYIAEIAAICAAPGWAQTEVALGGPATVAAAYAVLAVVATLALRALDRRRALGARVRARSIRALLVAAGLAASVAVAIRSLPESIETPAGLRVRMLDVGQGDAILLEQGGADAVLVDAGMPDAGVGQRLDELGVGRLAMLVVTHPELDHDGGAPEVLERLEVERYGYARTSPALLAQASAEGARPLRLSLGDAIRVGRARLDVLWPPPRPPGTRAAAGDDPNVHSLVVLVRFGDFRMLLTGDAEAEAAPVSPGPLDVLKVAHHGSADAALPALLERTQPEVALVSAGAGNPFGHPAASTLTALADEEVAVARTDTDGEVVIETDGRSWAVER